ncbi:MAG: putative zinc-binding metallopeptidase [Cyclobacteriaceae bacterium]
MTLLYSIPSVYASGSLSEDIDRIEEKLQVSIVVDETLEGTWKEVTYQLSSDTVALQEYLLLLEQEYAKYPVGYFTKIGVRTLVVCDKLKLNEQERAAVPDPYQGILFLSIGFRDNNSTYQIHVMHHELHHCAEYYHWNTMSYDWDSWTMTNLPAFAYRGSGASAYEDPSVDWYSISKPTEGFVNLYSTTAAEEDRAELVAIIMTENEKKQLDAYLEKDLILQQKVLLIKVLLTEISGEENSYWNRIFD